VTDQSVKHTLSKPARIWILIAAMATLATTLTWSVRHLSALDTPFKLPWYVLIPLVFLGEVAIVSLRFRREGHSFSMSELPLVVGLFFINPVGLIAAQLIGNALALGLGRRQPPKKLVFNLSLLTLQASLAVTVFRAIVTDADPLGVGGSLGTLLAVGVGVVAANVLINSAILISGGGLNRKEQVNTLFLGAASAGMNASLGLVAVTVMWTQPGTLWAAAVPPVALYLAYRAYVAQREKGQRIQALYEATKALLRSPEIEAAMLVAVRHARSMFDSERAEIQVFRSDAAGDAFRTFVGPDDETAVMERIHPNSDATAAEAQRTGRPQLHPCSTAGHGSPGHTVTHQMVAPIDGPQGVNGIIIVSEPLAQNRSFSPGDLRFLETLASQISVSLENGRLEDSLAHVTRLKDDLHFRALHDVLTGLGNRALLWDALSHLEDPTRGERQSAVLLLDLDDFKTVNDTLGHQAGDQLLVEVSRRLEACCRPDDTIARLGGDEFAILLDRMSSPGDATFVADRISNALAQPLMISGRPVVPRASMGIALVRSGTPPEELMRRADLAMYESKSKGKGTCSVYQEAGVAEPENPPTVLFEVVSTTTEDELHQGTMDLGIGENAL
jgi:diguanylate cyclase (GGDEF)-like protein